MKTTASGWGNVLGKKVKVKSLSHVQLFEIPWTVAYQAPMSMGSSRQEYWSGLPFPSPGDLPNPGIEPRSPALQADALPSEPQGKSIRQERGLRNHTSVSIIQNPLIVQDLVFLFK